MGKQARSLNGKVVVITGGGRGIGAATARALVAQGARVAIGDVDLETAERTAAELGGGTIARRLDVTDRPAFTAFLDEVERELGPLDVIINNAGIMPVTPADEESDASITRQIELNLHAVIHGTREAMYRFRPRGAGHIVNVASVAGKGGFPGVATYCATKHGVVGYSEAVRFELRGSGVEVSCVMPSIVRTELTAGVEDARFVKSIQPEDVANAIVGALQKPKFDVFVPKANQYMTQIMSVFPRSFREGLARALKADTVMMDAAHNPERAAYEQRAAASTPAAEERIEEEKASAAA
jgi:NAD(P)-dependent dehydrogenase (short-subunit alcohol dehydrogenase family)